jgi:N-acetylglutamate synthase-like GNAT family acetyltransferase
MGTNLTESEKTIKEKFDNLPRYTSPQDKGNCNYYNICVKHDGNIIARASFTICQCEVGIIGDFFIKEEYRGKGYGTKMLKYIENLMAIENDVKILTLITLPDARHFWEKRGYMNVGKYGMYKDGGLVVIG